MTLKGRPCPTCGRPLPETAAEKLERLVDRSGGPDACWPYRGRLNTHGYGMLDVWIGGRPVGLRAHRLAYEQVAGPLGDLAVLHLCDRRYVRGDTTYRRCCNPAHLTAGTLAENHAHMWDVGRQSDYSAMPRGEAVGTSSLSEGDVLEMRRRFAAGENAVQLSEAFGVSQPAAYNAIHGVTWGHLPGAQPKRGRGRGGRRSKANEAGQVRGERSGNAELSEAAVLEMRRRFAAGEQAIVLARAFGVSNTGAWNAIHGVTWAHVPEAITPGGRRGWPKGKPRGPRKRD
jgi:hypothetical protein